MIMSNSIKRTSLSRWPRFSRFLITETSSGGRVRAMRAVVFGALVAGLMVYAPAHDARLAGPAENGIRQGCPQPGAKVDLAFIIDGSGSLDSKVQGQTYNVEIEGVRRTVLDASLTPRDGSIAMAVFTFAGGPTLRVPFTEIKTEADAVAFAAKVEALKCVAAETCPLKGPNPETNAGKALLAANQYLGVNQRAGARRVFLVSTDGGFTDTPFGEIASLRIRDETVANGIASEVDAILLGRFANPDTNTDVCPLTDAAELQAAKERVSLIVFPDADDGELPGARFDISGGGCNCPGAAFGADCERQVREFVEFTRRVIRTQPAMRSFIVNTFADTTPGTPVTNTLSLRQAIERANIAGGAVTITFTSNLKNTTIRPRVPLPALTAPDIRICGCENMNCDYAVDPDKTCDPFLTIDGSGIDPTKTDSDGIVIGSDRAVVRGLRIINFARAGVSIEPVCNRGFSRIERNKFENNKKAGVRVLDVSASFGAAAHNVGNTISMNDIVGSETPIDLGGDGPTPNDPGDVDEGPNTLLNFPDDLRGAATSLDVEATAAGVTLAGQINGPAAAGATVEIFGITSFRASSGGSGGRQIDGVTFLKRATTNVDGSFIVTGLPDTPFCCYTATVTDLAGNTSELMFPGGGFPKAKTTPPAFAVEATPNGRPLSDVFSIENTGCATLSVSFPSISRNDFLPGRPPEDERRDDHDRFPIDPIIVGIGGQTITIQPGQKQVFGVAFDPAIPRDFQFQGRRLRLSGVLPDMVNDTIGLTHNGCTGSDPTVSLTARVNKKIKLIDPNDPKSDPVVTLSRSGDVFTVVFSIYDSNLDDVDSVTYEFFDRAGGRVDLNQPLRDLSAVVQQANLTKGQSFSIRQPFTNAKEHRDVARVLVTVFDKEQSKDSAYSSSILQTAARTQSSPSELSMTLDLPVIRLARVRHGR